MNDSPILSKIYNVKRAISYNERIDRAVIHIYKKEANILNTVPLIEIRHNILNNFKII